MNIHKFLNIKDTILLLILAFSVSCVPLKEVRYFNDINDTITPADNPREQKKIAPFDNIYIKVMSTDEKTANIFSTSELMITDLSTNLVSYMVDEKGDINFPFVGTINIGGITTSQASDKIQKALSEYIVNTAVTVNYINNKVTVMGEVQRQGVFQFSADKINIYEAISLGGGLTRYGNRKNTILIRQVDNKIMRYKIDLSNSKIMDSNLYYILPNDVIVIEPLKNIAWSYQNVTFTTVLSTITTLVAVLYFANIHF